MKTSLKLLSLFFILMPPMLQAASTNVPPTLSLANVKLVENAPTSYRIQHNDNLADILGQFVHEPVEVIALWGMALPDFRVGDIVSIIEQAGQPALQIKRGRTVKLSPNMRIIEKARKIPKIAINNIRQFLTRPQVIAEEELQHSGYIIGSDRDVLTITTDMTIYARGLDPLAEERTYMIVRPGNVYFDPEEEDEVLAREAIYLGQADIEFLETTDEWEDSDVTPLKVTSMSREIHVGDRLLPLDLHEFTEDFRLHSPEFLEAGYVLALPDNSAQVGQYQVIVINKGFDDDIEAGHVLAVNHSGKIIKDEIADEEVLLPSQRAATIMVFKTFEKISYALIMKSTLPVRLMDEVTLP